MIFFGQILTFDSENFDTDNMHSNVINNSRITITKTGKYSVGGNIQWAANINNMRSLGVVKNGSIFLLSTTVAVAGNNIAFAQNVSGIKNLLAGDYIELYVYQNSGGALNVNKIIELSPEFWCKLLN